MSFSTDIKQEIANNELEQHCKRAQLSALTKLTSSLIFSSNGFGLSYTSESPTTSKRTVYLLKELYDAKTQLEVARKTNLKKNNVYKITVPEKGKEILENLGLYSSRGLEKHPLHEVVTRNCCAASYLAGAFLAYGSCNDPSNASYHLEISVNDLEHANFLLRLISRFSLQAKIAKRRNRYIVYLKKADYVSDFLTLIGAHNAKMRFEDERIGRDIRNSVSRIDNCEIANEEKIIRAGEKQLNSIKTIIEADAYDKLPEKLKNVAEARQKYPESSLLELCDYYMSMFGGSISKSGMKHRLNKLEAIASELED
ncbi:MAG: DNA-binding protein WhiA [Erysipelotrichaceae bacterium]|nr:DNA-binding protein WhiA [Erysipelotrichaceae bacterium]